MIATIQLVSSSSCFVTGPGILSTYHSRIGSLEKPQSPVSCGEVRFLTSTLSSKAEQPLGSRKVVSVAAGKTTCVDYAKDRTGVRAAKKLVVSGVRAHPSKIG